MANKKIGVLGSGSVGKVLAGGFIKHGYEVMIGTRTISKLDEFKLKEPKVKVGSFEETAKLGIL